MTLSDIKKQVREIEAYTKSYTPDPLERIAWISKAQSMTILYEIPLTVLIIAKNRIIHNEVTK